MASINQLKAVPRYRRLVTALALVAALSPAIAFAADEPSMSELLLRL